mgnify:CR=1 FL=1
MTDNNVKDNPGNVMFGKPWQNKYTYKTFEGANTKRNAIIAEGKFQAKVKKRNDGTFVVKTRDLEIIPPAKTPKNKKRS